jgi:plastocyanin
MPLRPTVPPLPATDSVEPPAYQIYRESGTFGKSSGKEQGPVKFFPLAALLLIPGLLLDGSPVVRNHTVRLNGDSDNGQYRFSPSRLTVTRGDTVVFQVESGGPHALALDPAGLTAGVRDAWNQALPRRTGLLRGPLIRADQPYRVVIPRGITAGKYLIFCLPHRAYDMRLELDVK